MRVLKAILIAPARYDERGVVVFRRGMSPNGALAALAGMAEDYNRRHAGETQIDYDFFDEHVRQAITPTRLKEWRDRAATLGQRLVLMVCGVQTVTYPRARDIALMARRDGMDVIAGGVHLSGHGRSVAFLMSCGVSVAIGEVEPIWDQIIEDALAGQFAPLYRISAEQGIQVRGAVADMVAPDIDNVPFPHIPRAYRHHYVNPAHLFVDTSRGCPFLCTFCVVKNVFGRTVRGRDPKRLVAWMVDRVEHDGIRAFSFTDDNFVRNPRHREVLERLAAARAGGVRFSVTMILDVESSCYAEEDSPRGKRTREFLRLCEAAGAAQVYMGLESTNDAALQEMHKGVNRDRGQIHSDAHAQEPATAKQRLIQRYRTAIRAWHRIGVSVECGYILGFKADSRGIGTEAVRDLAAIGTDLASFYLVAPLPGSEDYARAIREGLLLEVDFNNYFRRAMLAHPTMTALELENELDTGIALLWSWPVVLRRIASGIFGIDRKRVAAPWVFLRRQLGYKLMTSAGMRTDVEGGLFRRGAAYSAPREVVTDEEARHFYLGDTVALPSPGFPEIMRDESRIESLPVLVARNLGSKLEPIAMAG